MITPCTFPTGKFVSIMINKIITFLDRKSVIYFFIETKKSSQLRAVQSAALWFYAGIKHKTLKKENRMKFVCIFSRKSGGEKSEGISVNPFRSVVGKPHSRFYAISLNLRGKRKA